MRSHISRLLIVIGIAATVLTASLLRGAAVDAFTVGPTTDAAHNAGQTLTLQNEAVQLRFVSVSASFDNEFGRDTPAPAQEYFTCRGVNPGFTMSGGTYAGPVELVFHLNTPTGNHWVTGPGSRNSDGLAHARITAISGGVRVAWEDTPLGQSDFDYNDCVVDVLISPVSTSTPTASATATRTNTASATSTATITSTSTPTATATATATSTLTPTPTNTALPSFSDLGLTADQSEVPAGIAAVSLSDVPFTALTQGDGPASSRLSSTRLSSTLLGSIRLSSTRLSSTRLSSTFLGLVKLSSIPISRPGGWEAVLQGTSLEGVPLQSVSLGDLLSLDPPPAALSPSSPVPLTLANVDLGETALKSLNLMALALGPTPLDSIATPPGFSDWCAALESAGTSCDALGYNTSTIGSATLLDLNVQGVALGSTRLSSTRLSSTDLSAAGIGSLTLSTVPAEGVLNSIPIGSIPVSTLTDGSLASVRFSSTTLPAGHSTWCAYFASQGFDCGTLELSETSTLAEVAAAFQRLHVSVASSPIGPIQLGSVQLDSTTLSAVRLSSTDLASIAINGTRLSSTLLSNVDLDTAQLSLIRLSSTANPGAVANCALVDCATATLGDAEAAHAILIGATLGDLGTYGTSTVQDVLSGLGASPSNVEYFLSFFYGDGTLADVTGGSPVNLGDVTLGQLLVAMLVRSDYPWENLPLDALTSSDVPGTGVLTYQATFHNGGGSVPSDLAIDLPAGSWYVPGSSQLHVVNGATNTTTPAADPDVAGADLTWHLPGFNIGDAVMLQFQVRPGLHLGVRSASISLQANGFAGLETDNQAPVNILENYEPNDDPDTAPIADPDVLYLGHISNSDDKDFFRVAAVNPGARVSVFLSHLAQDDDLALFMPNSTELRPSSSRLSSTPLDDAPPDILSNEPPPVTLQDIKLAGLPLGDVSDQRGTSAESVAALSLDDTGFYTLEVAGYNGSSSDDPYVLRVRVTPPPPIPACAARTFAHDGEGVAGTLPGSIPSNVNTLFIVDQKRMGDLYGASAANNVMSSLTTLAGHSDLGVIGAVLPVEGNGAVASAFSAWDANPCSPVGANDVVTAINALVDGYRASLPDLQNIVIVGSDDAIPFARVPDLTHISNESDYTNDALAINGNNALVGSFVTSNILSDNPYGTFHPIGVLNRQVYVPEVALGRLVETPDQIQAQVAQFIQFQGELDPTTALTTGYDFLADGATNVANSLDGLVGPLNSSRLINGTWTSDDLTSAFNDHTPVPGIASLNAHFDHYRLLPGAGNTANDESDLYTTAEIARNGGPAEMPGLVVFSMGCHSGVNVSDLLAPGATGDQAARLFDWPEAFSDQKAAVFVANTGYGYGDTDTVAYSEELMSLFAQNFAGDMTLGQALTAAKQSYYGDLVQYQTYDEKVLAEATFYGLPMFRLPEAAGPALPPPMPLPFTTDPITGFEGVSLDLSPVFDPVDLGALGKYYEIDGRSQPTSGRPIQPVTGVDLPRSPDGKTARGIVVTGLDSTDESPFDPVFTAPGSDSSQPEQDSDGTFPASIHHLTSVATSSGLKQRAMFMPAQYIPDSSTPGTGTERTYTHIQAFVPFSDSPDVTPPTINETHAANVGGVVTFVADVEDDQPDNVARVLVVYKPELSGHWVSLDLVHTPNDTRWTGSAALTGTVQYDVYGLDGSGNVAVSSNKGDFHQTVSAAISSGLSITESGTPGNDGWLFDAMVTVTGDPGVQFTVKVDGGAQEAYTGPFAVTGPGYHVVTAAGSDGSTGGAVVALDDVGPTAVISTPAEGAVFLRNEPVTAQYICLDAGSGVETCDGPVADGAALDTSVPGAKVFVVSATDVAGNDGGGSSNYTVSTQCYLNLSCDGIPDSYKQAQPCFASFPLTQDIAGLDPDSDGLTNLQEFALTTDPCNPDTDADGCKDGKETGASHILGGQRDPKNGYDFYDVPVPFSPVFTNAGKNKAINVNDIIAVRNAAGTNAAGPGYNAQYDRTPSLFPGQPWRSGPPNGAVTAQDVLVSRDSTGDMCP